MSTCRSCRFYVPGDSYPHYGSRGTCSLIHASGAPRVRTAQVRPTGNGWMEVASSFGCTLHEVAKTDAGRAALEQADAKLTRDA